MDNSIIEQLRALVAGDYSGWKGLPASCTRVEVEEALREEGMGPSEPGNLNQAPEAFYTYNNTPSSPYGAIVWYENDLAAVLRMHTVTPVKPVEKQLGAPEAKDPSGMGGFCTQWIYASRGLTIHFDDFSGNVAWLFAYHPMTLEEFRASWIHKVEIIRHRDL